MSVWWLISLLHFVCESLYSRIVMVTISAKPHPAVMFQKLHMKNIYLYLSQNNPSWVVRIFFFFFAVRKPITG